MLPRHRKGKLISGGYELTQTHAKHGGGVGGTLGGAGTMIRGTSEAWRRSRALRRELTLPEVLLWQQLRRRGAGHKWRKQHAAGPYTLDFYCDAAKLCVEVDGEAHDRGDRPARDARRDAWLAAQGIATLRIAAADILRNLEGVVTFIAARAGERAPLHPPAAPGGPPPRAELGEE